MAVVQERVSHIEPFISKFNCDGIEYPSEIDNWKIFESNNQQIAQYVK